MAPDHPGRGEIWWISLPGGKTRPCVIISPHERNQEEQNYLVAACSSQRINKIYPDEVDISELNMPKPSKIQCDYIMTVCRRRLKEKITTLWKDKHIPQLNKALKAALAID
jgi:mRNA-degrading endonuclease toxin of MazEF toxin-antitoxin module